MSIYKSAESTLLFKKTSVSYSEDSAKQLLLKLEADLLLAQRIYSNLVTEEAPPFGAPVSVWTRYINAISQKEADVALLQDKIALHMRIRLMS